MRIDVFAALGSAQGDTAPPTGSVVINGGAQLTRTASVSLAIAASDASGVDKMCVTNTEDCTVFEAFAATRAWSRAVASGERKFAGGR